jgi:hypothetical protein
MNTKSATWVTNVMSVFILARMYGRLAGNRDVQRVPEMEGAHGDE